MGDRREEEILEECLKLKDKKVALFLINLFKDMKSIKNDMVKNLNLLDDIADGDESKKDILRSKILDNYNDLPRKTLKTIEKLVNQLKE